MVFDKVFRNRTHFEGKLIVEHIRLLESTFGASLRVFPVITVDSSEETQLPTIGGD